MMMPENNNNFELNNNENVSENEINNTAEKLNSPEWLFAKKLSNIDEKFILEYLAYEKKRRRARVFKQIRTAAACAACVCIAVGGVIFGAYKMGQSPEVPDVTEDISALSSGSATDTSAETSLYNEEDFVIDENGRLLAYLGNDTEVYIPDTVTEITADALNQSASADQIVKVHITSSTRHIDEKAFSELDSIEEVEIDEDNEHYYFCNGVLMLSDFSLQIAVSKEANNDLSPILDAMFVEIGNRKTSSDLIPERIRAVTDEGEFELRVETEYNKISFTFYLTSLQSHGHTLSFGDTEIMCGTYTYGSTAGSRDPSRLSLLINDELFIMENQSPANWKIYIFTDEEITELKGTVCGEEDINTYSFYTIDPNSEFELTGKLAYTRVPAKFGTVHDMGDTIRTCVARDELHHEDGYLTVENGRLIFNVEKTYTMSDCYDLDAEYAKLQPALDEFLEEYAVDGWTKEDFYMEDLGVYSWNGVPIFDTFDEFLEYNKQNYERAY